MDFRAPKDRAASLAAGVILMVTLTIMFAMVWPSFRAPGFLAAWDGGGHLLKAFYLARHLLPHGRLTGWFPLWHGGFDLFQCYPPLLYYGLAPLTWMMESELALRVATALLWLGLMPVTYYFLRSFAVDPLAAAEGVALVPVLNHSLGVGLGALYGLGLLPNGLGLLLAIATLGRLKRDLSDPARGPRHWIVTGLLVGLQILAHTFTSYWWAMAATVLVLSEAMGSPRGIAIVTRFLGILCLAALVSAYWWVPLAMNLGQMSPPETMVPRPRGEMAEAMLFATDGGGPIIGLLALAGLAFLFLRRRWRALMFLAIVATFSFLLGLNLINRALPFHSVVGSTQFMRFQPFFALIWTLLAGFGVASVIELGKDHMKPLWAVGAVIFVTVSLLLGVVEPTLVKLHGYISGVANAATPELDPIAHELRARLAPGDFVLSEFNWDARYALGSPHFVTQRLPLLVPDAWDVEGNFPEATRGAAHAHYLASVLGAADYVRTQRDYLASRGVRFIITTTAATRKALASVSWLRLVKPGEQLSLFELVGPRRPMGLPDSLAAQVSAVSYDDAGVYRITFQSPVTIPAGTSLALSHHPWLRASSERGPIAVREDGAHQLALAQVARDVRTLTIAYTPPRMLWMADALSALAWIVALGALLGSLRRD
jgi:hypothetical protein